MRKQYPAEYSAWSDMKTRCTNPNKSNFRYYGGRGISVCIEWTESFECFLSDMGPKPDPSFSLDRIDNNKDYTPDNCRWADHKTQCWNKSNNLYLMYNGERLSVPEIADRTGVRAEVIYRRYYRGTQSPDLFRPVKQITSKSNPQIDLFQ